MVQKGRLWIALKSAHSSIVRLPLSSKTPEMIYYSHSERYINSGNAGWRRLGEFSLTKAAPSNLCRVSRKLTTHKYKAFDWLKIVVAVFSLTEKLRSIVAS